MFTHLVLKAFAMPLVLAIFRPDILAIALVMEIVVFHAIQPHVRIVRVIAAVIAMNLVSTLGELALGWQISSSLTESPENFYIMQSDPHFKAYAILAWTVAFVFCSIIHYGFLWAYRVRIGIKDYFFTTAACMNVPVYLLGTPFYLAMTLARP